MTIPRPTVLRFKLRTELNPVDLMEYLRPGGKILLNRNEWRGKPPRSCALTNMKVRSFVPGKRGAIEADLEVEYRPPGYVNFVGGTRYDGWTLTMLDKAQDGTLLDGHGKPLPTGSPPVYLPFEVYDDVDFNDLDFGEFLGESEAGAVRHLTFEDVTKQAGEYVMGGGSGRMGSGWTTFVAPRRHRPLVKVVIMDGPSGVGADGFGTRIVGVNAMSPHLRQQVEDELTEVACGYVEGRYSLVTMELGGAAYVDLSQVLVDGLHSEEGARLQCLPRHVSETFMDDLAKKLMATYTLDVAVVDGPRAGFVMRVVDPK